MMQHMQPRLQSAPERRQVRAFAGPVLQMMQQAQRRDEYRRKYLWTPKQRAEDWARRYEAWESANPRTY